MLLLLPGVQFKLKFFFSVVTAWGCTRWSVEGYTYVMAEGILKMRSGGRVTGPFFALFRENSRERSVSAF